MVLHHFEYTAEMCDCRYCPYYRGKRKCTASQCPCIEERIVAGAASRAEVMAETMRDIHNGAFRRRLNQFIKEREELHMNFRNEKHRLAFVEAIRKLDKKNFALMSALYLLTAEHKLWMQIRNYVERNEIKFERFKPKDSTENGYTLLCCAKDLYLQIGDEAYVEHKLKNTLEQHDTLDSFDSELTNKTVKLIKLAENGSVSIILINDQEIRKEQTDHANSNPSDAT